MNRPDWVEKWADYPGFDEGFADDIFEEHGVEFFEEQSKKAQKFYPDYFIGSDPSEITPDSGQVTEFFASSNLTMTEFNVASIKLIERIRNFLPSPDDEVVVRRFYEVAEHKRMVSEGDKYDPDRRGIRDIRQALETLKSVEPLTSLRNYKSSLKFYEEYVYHGEYPSKHSRWKLKGDSGVFVADVTQLVEHDTERGRAIFDPFPVVEIQEIIEGDGEIGEGMLTPGYFNRGQKIQNGESPYKI